VVNDYVIITALSYNQAIKDDFHRSKFLIPVSSASTGDVYVTTPCSSCMMACMPSVFWECLTV